SCLYSVIRALNAGSCFQRCTVASLTLHSCAVRLCVRPAARHVAATTCLLESRVSAGDVIQPPIRSACQLRMAALTPLRAPAQRTGSALQLVPQGFQRLGLSPILGPGEAHTLARLGDAVSIQSIAPLEHRQRPAGTRRPQIAPLATQKAAPELDQ